MKIAIISDVHDNIPSLKKVLDYCAQNEIKNIICCGDLGERETLDFLNANFDGEIFFAWGNVEHGHFGKNELGQKYKKTNIFEDFGEAKIADKNVAFVHYPREAKELAESGKYDFVFYGHTHKPWEEMIGQCKVLNPGNVAGGVYPPTFAVWSVEEEKFELIRIHDLK